MEAQKADIYTLIEVHCKLPMKARVPILIASLGLVFCNMASSEIRMFLPTEKPTVSLVQAARIMEEIIKKTDIKDFNPFSVTLTARSKAGSGAWNFIQQDKEGKVYRFVVYFPDDVCLILDENDGQKLINAFKRDGSSLKMDEEKNLEFGGANDPFGD